MQPVGVKKLFYHGKRYTNTYKMVSLVRVQTLKRWRKGQLNISAIGKKLANRQAKILLT